MKEKGKFIFDGKEPYEIAEPVLEYPDGDGGCYQWYMGVAVRPDEKGEARIVKSNDQPNPSQRLLQESFKNFLRNGGEEWLKKRHLRRQ
jgi:hypothetical protein